MRTLGIGTALLLLSAAGGWMIYPARDIGPDAVADAPRPAQPVSSTFGPTVANTAGTPGSAPEGMVWIPGGEFSMGANDPPDMHEVGMQTTEDARPIHRAYVDGFFMDRTASQTRSLLHS